MQAEFLLYSVYKVKTGNYLSSPHGLYMLFVPFSATEVAACPTSSFRRAYFLLVPTGTKQTKSPVYRTKR